MTTNPSAEIDKRLDEIFSLEFIAAPEMLIDEKGLMFRWNQEWLADTKSQLLELINEARKDELNNMDDRLYDIPSVNWGDPTEGSQKDWGKNHADLWIPTRDMHKVFKDRLSQLSSTNSEAREGK